MLRTIRNHAGAYSVPPDLGGGFTSTRVSRSLENRRLLEYCAMLEVKHRSGLRESIQDRDNGDLATSMQNLRVCGFDSTSRPTIVISHELLRGITGF